MRASSRGALPSTLMTDTLPLPPTNPTKASFRPSDDQLGTAHAMGVSFRSPLPSAFTTKSPPLRGPGPPRVLVKAILCVAAPARPPDRAASAGEAVSGCVVRSTTVETATTTSATSAADAA